MSPLNKAKVQKELPEPPEAWNPIRRLATKIKAPVDRFLAMETAGGIILLLAAALALVWANSPWKDSYFHLWHTKFGLELGGWSMKKDFHFWINELGMTLFFLVAGFEIKREIRDGELSDLRRATLPMVAALGGMVVPALIYVVFNMGGETMRGWGVPMATDIAFAVGILSLLGKRVPASMRILLLALAIIDDLGAILVIALFYTENLNMQGLGIVGLGIAILFAFRRIGVRPGNIYLLPLLTLWGGLYKAGIHPTLAGVIVGLSSPAIPRLGREQFVDIAGEALDEYKAKAAVTNDDHDLLYPLRKLMEAGREAVAPVIYGEATFHSWVSFFIMPMFALANAGVDLSTIDFNVPNAHGIILGVALGLAIGKPLGVVLFTWAVVRMGYASLPTGVGWKGIIIVGMVAGIGFTMSLFIAELAFTDAGMLGMAKLGVLIATAAAAIIGLFMGFRWLPKPSKASTM